MNAASPLSVKPFLIAWCICLIVAEFVGATLAPIQRADFRSFYAAGYLIRTHPSQLYDLAQQQRVQSALVSFEDGVLPFYHPDYEAFIYAPFSMLKYRTAYRAVIAFNMLLLMAAFYVARPAFSSPIPFWQPRPGLIFFIFLPVLIAAIQGQDSFLTLLLYCGTWRQLASGRNMSAGSLLALAMFKPHLVIPIAVLIGIRSGWRFVTGFLVTSVGVGLLCIGVVGRAGTVSLVRLLRGAGAAIGKNAIAQRTMSVYPQFMPSLPGLFHSCGHFLRLPIAFTLLCGICVIGLFVWCAFEVRRHDQDVAFSIAVLCSLLVSYHIYIYDLTLCLLPMVLLARRTQWAVMVALFGLPVVLLFHVGLDWAFLMAVPMLAMLVNAIVSSRDPVASEPETAPAPA